MGVASFFSAHAMPKVAATDATTTRFHMARIIAARRGL
jgi:hypothetical protein